MRTGYLPLTAPAWRGSRLALPRAAKTAGSVAPQGVCSSRAHSRAPPRFVKPKPPKGGGHFSRKSHSLRQSLQKAPGNRGFFASTALAARPLTLPPAKVDSARSAAEPSLAPPDCIQRKLSPRPTTGAAQSSPCSDGGRAEPSALRIDRLTKQGTARASASIRAVPQHR